MQRMQRIDTWRKQFNWRMVLMRIVVNALALLITAGLVPNIYFVERNVLSWLLLALALGILNALIKPIIQFLTLRFIFATYGVVVALINAILLFMLALLLPKHLEVNGIFWALVGGAVLGIVSALFESLLGLTPPIVSEKHPELRRRIQERASGSIEATVSQATADRVLADGSAVQKPVVSPATEAAAVLAALGGPDAPPPVPSSAASASAELGAEPEELAREAVTAAPSPTEQEA